MTGAVCGAERGYCPAGSADLDGMLRGKAQTIYVIGLAARRLTKCSRSADRLCPDSGVCLSVSPVVSWTGVLRVLPMSLSGDDRASLLCRARRYALCLTT